LASAGAATVASAQVGKFPSYHWRSSQRYWRWQPQQRLLGL